MILHFEFHVIGDRWRVRVAETGFARDVPNVMAYNARGKVVSLGEYPPDVRSEVARAVPIYDATSFDPTDTARSVRFYTMLAQQEVRRGMARVLDLFDRYDLTFDLPGYSETAADLRRRFEQELHEMTFVRSYTINGRKRNLPWTILRR